MLETRIAQWEQELIQKGVLLGKEEGILLGKEQGWQLGKEEGLANQKKTLLEMLSARFGEVPIAWQTTITQLADPEVISQLTVAVLKVKSPMEYNSLLIRGSEN